MHHSDLRGVPSGYDVVVIGAGAAGMSAALFAPHSRRQDAAGGEVSFVGGTSALSAGSIWIPNTRHASAIAASDSADNAERYLQQIIGNRADANLRAAFLKAGPEAVDVLEDHSEVKLRAYPRHPDYRSELEGAAVAGRALEPLPFDGRLLGDALRLVRPPIPEFTLLGGMMVDRTDIGHLLSATRSMKSLLHAAKLLARYGRDRLRHPRGSAAGDGQRAGRPPAVFAAPARCRHSDGHVAGQNCPRCEAAASPQRFWSRGGVSREIGIDGGLILAGGGFNRHAARRPRRWGPTRRGPPLRPVRAATRRTRRSRSAPASATAISAPRSGRRPRSGAGATARRRCFRTSCSTAASRARWWSTATAAASSTKRSPIINSRWRCWRRAIGDPGIPDRGCGGVAEIRSRHGAPRRLGHARRFGRRLPRRRRHASSNWRND